MMNDELMMSIMTMISSAGIARSFFINAVNKAKEGDFEGAKREMEQGDVAFETAHNAHAVMLSASVNAEEEGRVSLFLVHAEDQMMAAETFRILADELIEIYKKLR